MNKTALTFAVFSVLAQPVFAGGFVEDSKLNLGLRTFYIDNDNREHQGEVGNAAYSGQTRETGQAFTLNYVSGYTSGLFGVGVDAYAGLGVRLDSGGRAGKAGADRTPGNLFPLESDGSATSDYGQAGLTGKARIGGSELRFGRLIPRLPILVPNDGRLLPQSFKGTQITIKDIDSLTLTGGVLEHVLGRASTNQTGFAVNGGTQESNKFWFAGGDWAVNKSLTTQYYYANLEDYYQQHFLGATHVLPLGVGQSLKTDLRFFRTTADGANDSAQGRANGYKVAGYTETAGRIDNRTWSAALTYNQGGHSITLGHQRVSDGSAFVQLNQGSLANEGAGGASVYLLTDRLVHNFARAGERTTFGTYLYNFAALGIPGLQASVTYLSGDNIKVAGGTRQSEWERDLSLDYVIQDGTFKGLGVGLRHGALRSEAASDLETTRLMLNYQIALF